MAREAVRCPWHQARVSFHLQPDSLFCGCFKELKTEENKNILGKDLLLTTHLCLKCVLPAKRIVRRLQEGLQSCIFQKPLEGDFSARGAHCIVCAFILCLRNVFASAPEKLITDITDRPCLLAKLSPWNGELMGVRSAACSCPAFALIQCRMLLLKKAALLIFFILAAFCYVWIICTYAHHTSFVTSKCLISSRGSGNISGSNGVSAL